MRANNITQKRTSGAWKIHEVKNVVKQKGKNGQAKTLPKKASL